MLLRYNFDDNEKVATLKATRYKLKIIDLVYQLLQFTLSVHVTVTLEDDQSFPLVVFGSFVGFGIDLSYSFVGVFCFVSYTFLSLLAINFTRVQILWLCVEGYEYVRGCKLSLTSLLLLYRPSLNVN